MKLFEWANFIIKTLKWYHIFFLKLSVASAVLMIAKLRSGILVLDWYYYGLIMLFAMLPLLKKMFIRK